MNDITLSSWDDFTVAVNHLDLAPPGKIVYLYRGQANKDWTLKPSLLRHLIRLEASEEEALQIEAISVDEFISQAHLHLPHGIPTPTNQDLFGCWSLMQHYGAPTRLLDWTKSIYIAAYFAVIQELDKEGALWIVHKAAFDTKMAEIYNYTGLPGTLSEQKQLFTETEAKPIIDFLHRNPKTDRMITQQGAYSICFNILADHSQVIGDALTELQNKTGKIYLQRLIIPSEMKLKFIRKVRMMNITASSLFPGIDGLGRSVAELVTLGVK